MAGRGGTGSIDAPAGPMLLGWFGVRVLVRLGETVSCGRWSLIASRPAGQAARGFGAPPPARGKQWGELLKTGCRAQAGSVCLDRKMLVLCALSVVTCRRCANHLLRMRPAVSTTPPSRT